MRDIRTVLRERLKAALEEDRQQHLRTPAVRPVYSIGLDRHEDPVAADIECIDFLLHDAREALARRDLTSVGAELDELMEAEGFPEAKRVELGLGLVRVRVTVLEQARDNLIGGVAPSMAATAGTSGGTSEGPLSEPEAVLLSEEVPNYVQYCTTQKGWSGQTINQYNLSFRLFQEIVGDLPVQLYKRVHLGRFYDALMLLPKMHGKGGGMKDMGALELIDRFSDADDIDRLTMKTVSRHFTAVRGFFTWLKRRGLYDGENPATDFEFPDRRNPSELRGMWEGDRLVRLLESPQWTGCKSSASRSTPGELIFEDAKYWLPLLGLYHGNRLEEFAQLCREDIQQEDGVWVLKVTDEGERQLKNRHSIRTVPLHPRTEELGFLEYVSRIASKPTDRIFPELRPGGADNKLGHNFSKWWTRYRREVGVYEVGLDYHSFRHGVTTQLYDADVDEIVIDELTGHAGGGTSRRVYKKKSLPVERLRKAMCKVVWPEERIRHDPTKKRISDGQAQGGS